MDYFDLPHMSNSDLSELDRQINARELPANIQQLFSFGHLTDALTGDQENNLNYESGILKVGNEIHTFNEEQMNRAILMKAAYEADPLLQKAFYGAKDQYWFVRERFRIEHEGFEFFLRAKCKCDKYRKDTRLIGEIKSTAAKSQKEFEAQAEHLDYDRAGALYMDLGKVDRYLLVGLSKHKNKHTKLHEVYIIVVQRGDPFYERGKKKYQELAYKYHLLIQQFN